MEYEEYVKKYCDNCAEKDCARIPVNNDGSLIDKDDPNICMYYRPTTELSKLIEWIKSVPSFSYSENIDKIAKILKFLDENDLLIRDDVYNFLEFECNSLKEAVDGLYKIDKIDFNF